MIINTNVSSLHTRNYLRQNNSELQIAMERLSSGKRINHAADDAAGLSITTRMTTQIRGMDVAERNANDGISLLQTAESAMGSISDILQRMRELAVQADNGTYSSKDKDAMQSEMQALLNEIDHIANNTKFNGIALLNGSTTVLSLHISDISNDTLTIGFSSLSTTSLTIGSLSIGTGGNPQSAITSIDAALEAISAKRADLGAMQNRLSFTIDNLNTAHQNTIAARSRIEDADMAEEMSKMTRSEILTQTAISMLTKANQNPQQILKLLQ